MYKLTKNCLTGNITLKKLASIRLGGITNSFWIKVCTVKNVFAIRRNGFENKNKYREKIAGIENTKRFKAWLEYLKAETDTNSETTSSGTEAPDVDIPD